MDLLDSNSITDTFEFYLFSFSQHRDDSAQWADFGRKSTGYSIGFASSLFEPSETELKPHANENLFVGKVIYGDEAIRNRHVHVVRKAAEIASRVASRNRQLVSKAVLPVYLSAISKEVIASQLIWNCLTGKRQKFEHEREVRFLILNVRDKFDGVRKQYCGKSYIEAPLPLKPVGNIPEIIVGAQAPHNAETVISQFLRIQGYPAIPLSRSSKS